MKDSTAFWIIYPGFVAGIMFLGKMTGAAKGFGTGEFVIVTLCLVAAGIAIQRWIKKGGFQDLL